MCEAAAEDVPTMPVALMEDTVVTTEIIELQVYIPPASDIETVLFIDQSINLTDQAASEQVGPSTNQVPDPTLAVFKIFS